MLKRLSSFGPWMCFVQKQSTKESHLVTYATQAATAAQLTCPHFYTLECDPVNHTLDHEARFYRITPRIHKQIFHLGGLPKDFEILSKTFREHCIMVRKPALEIIRGLENTDYSMPANRYILYGKRGCGKSLTLAHILHYGYSKKWILLHVPYCANWTRRPKEIAPSVTNPDLLDLPVDAAIWLQQFQSQNCELLKELNICTTKTYTWSKREVSEEGSPLLSVAEHGVNRLKYASDCVAVILKEIKSQSQTKGFNVLVTANGANSFFTITNIKKKDRTWANPHEVSLVHAFKKLFKSDWHNAAIVVTVDSVAASLPPSLYSRDLYTPKCLLEKEGFEYFDPFIPVLVPIYSEKEIESCLDYYTDRMWIQSEEAKSEMGRSELKFLSAHNPFKLMEICGPL